VIGIAVNPQNALSKTNVCMEIIFAPTAQKELIFHLVQLGSRLDEKAFLFHYRLNEKPINPKEETNFR